MRTKSNFVDVCQNFCAITAITFLECFLRAATILFAGVSSNHHLCCVRLVYAILSTHFVINFPVRFDRIHVPLPGNCALHLHPSYLCAARLFAIPSFQHSHQITRAADNQEAHAHANHLQASLRWQGQNGQEPIPWARSAGHFGVTVNAQAQQRRRTERAAHAQPERKHCARFRQKRMATVAGRVSGQRIELCAEEDAIAEKAESVQDARGDGRSARRRPPNTRTSGEEIQAERHGGREPIHQRVHSRLYAGQRRPDRIQFGR